MIRFICGLKGAGKTKRLIDMANGDVKKGIENIVFVDFQDNQLSNLDYSVRLIDAIEFNVNNVESLYGFLCGIIAGNYDINNIYVDNMYNFIEINDDVLENLIKRLEKICDTFNTNFHISLNVNAESMPSNLKELVLE